MEPDKAPIVNQIIFPVLCFTQIYASVENSLNDLTICNKGALKNGFFDNMLIVDLNGVAYKVNGAIKLHSVGLFSGYNIFFNQKIRVELQFDDDTFHMSIDEVKIKLYNSFKKRREWSARGDFAELKQKVSQAMSIAEIVQLISYT